MTMRRATAVIGANFGDEGKGLMTDYFVSRLPPTPLVVRFNGGAQAGHTVEEPDGRRHVFHHFGAGSFLGCPTFLSRFFIVNPILWDQERRELAAKGLYPRLYIDQDAPVTTPYDMVINQAAAKLSRHGSVGIGINETVVRTEVPEFSLRFGDLRYPERIKSICDRIRFVYSARRMIKLGIKSLPSGGADVLYDPASTAKFIDLCNFMGAAFHGARLTDPDMRDWTDIVFEGAQGLLLDEDYQTFFPYLSRSKTGLHNVMKLAIKAGIEQVDAVYVTRAYLTRHGAGPLPNEDPALHYDDDTNVDHPFQGPLRFAPLDPRALIANIMDDLRPHQDRHGLEVSGGVKMPWVVGHLAITHLDQMRNDAIVWKIKERAAAFRSITCTYGPTRSDVHTMIEPDQAREPSTRSEPQSLREPSTGSEPTRSRGP